MLHLVPHHQVPTCLETLVRELGIRRLFHFTPVANLQGIHRHGLLSVDELERRGLRAVRPDSLRLDGLTSGVSVSISWPNSFVLWRKKSTIPMALLELDPAVLWEHPCGFYPSNAARGDLRFLDTLRTAPRGRAAGRQSVHLAKLFTDKVERTRREHLAYPDDVQAEVLVFGDGIATSAVRRVVFERQACLSGALRGVPATVDASLFGPRPLPGRQFPVVSHKRWRSGSPRGTPAAPRR